MKKGKEIEEQNADDGKVSFPILTSRWKTTLIFVIWIVDANNDDAEPKERVRIPHSRTDLLNKFESLKVADDEDDVDDDDEDLGSDFDFVSDEESS